MCIGLGLQGITQIALFWCKKGTKVVPLGAKQSGKEGLAEGVRADDGNILNLMNYPFNNAGIPVDAGAAETV